MKSSISLLLSSFLKHIVSGILARCAALCKDKFRKMFGYRGEMCEVPVVDVTTDNVDRELPEIMDAIDKADIVALDCVSSITKCNESFL